MIHIEEDGQLVIDPEHQTLLGESFIRFLNFQDISVIPKGTVMVHKKKYLTYFQTLDDVSVKDMRVTTPYYAMPGSIYRNSKDLFERFLFKVGECRLPTKIEYMFYKRIDTV